MATTASEGVFNIVELRAMIILQLPAIDIVRARRINKSFKETIDRTQSVQRELFLVEEDDRKGTVDGDTEVKINPLWLTCTEKLRPSTIEGWDKKARLFISDSFLW